MESEKSPEEALADELLDVARRGVPGTFGVYNKYGKEVRAALPIHQLPLIIERSARQLCQENRWSTALELTLKRAISQLRGKFGSLQKGQADTRITNEEAALRFFNFDGSPSFPHVKPVDFDDIKYDHIKGPNYNKVLYELIKAARLDDSESTITREVKKLRFQLAKALVTLDVQPTSLAFGQDPVPVDVQNAGVDTGTEGDVVPYIGRPQYHKAFEDLVAQGYKLIAFEGEPGNGKSRLADELIAKRIHADTTRIYLRAHSTTNLMTDIAGVLQVHAGHKIETYPTTDDALIRAFAAFISSADAPAYLLIDNVEDPELVGCLVPQTARPLVVVTSRENMLPEGRGKSITVREMEDTEARQFAALLLPDRTDEEIDRLIKSLGNRPLAIDHVCTGLLADGYMTVQEFCTAFEHRAAVVMKQAKSPRDESLSFIYEQVLSRLREQDAKDDTKAAILLELIAFVAPEAIPEEFLRSALVAASPPEDPSLASVEFQSAQRELRRLHLVQLMNNEFTVHQFTQAVLRDILRDVEVERCLGLHRMLLEEFIDLQPGDALNTRTMRLLPHASSILLGLTSINRQIQASEGIERTLSILAQGMRQVGNIGAFLRFFKRFFSIDPSNEIEPEILMRSAIQLVKSGAIHFIGKFKEDYYHGGIMPRSTYANEMLLMTQKEHGELTAIDLISPAGAKILRINMLRYQYDFVNTVLASDTMRRIQNYHKEDAAWKGDILRLTAEAQAAQGNFDEAFITYIQACRAYDLNPQNLNCLRGIFTTLVSIADTALEVGSLHLAKASLDDAQNLRKEVASIYNDSPIIARIQRAIVRLMTVTSILSFVTGEHEAAVRQIDYDAIFDDQMQNSIDGPSGLQMFAVKYDWGCHRLLHNDTEKVREVFQEQAVRAERLEELDTALMYRLGLIKIRVIEGTASQADIDVSLQIGNTALDNCHMPNRHADAIGTAYVIAVLCDSPGHSVNSLRESARSAYAAIGKTWKFELLDHVGGEAFNPMTLFLP